MGQISKFPLPVLSKPQFAAVLVLGNFFAIFHSKLSYAVFD